MSPVRLWCALIVLVILPSRALALERLCDPAHEDCRAPLLSLIRAETAGIDVAFWFMEDTRYASALIERWRAGVPVRVLMDTEANVNYPINATSLQMLRDAGIPMREKTSTAGILHWKMMLFVGQNTVEFSGANYSSEAFVPQAAYTDYVDEVIYFTSKSSYVGTFKTRYEDAWTDTTSFANYANINAPLVRNYATFALDPALNFVPWQNFRTRSINAYRAESAGVDAIMYRITDRSHTDELIAAKARGVRVRVITEQLEYRNPQRLWSAWNVDRLYAAGIAVKVRGHTGFSHEKLTLLSAQRMAIFGSSNWTSASAEGQHEHNLFTTDAAFYTWSRAHFDRKWNNTGPAIETQPFVPQPPDTPGLRVPANGATGQPTTITLKWAAGLWAHKYDVYVGTSQSNMTKVIADRELGPSQFSTDYRTLTVTGLVAGTTYYWKVTSRTMANLERTSGVFTFSTAGSGGAATAPLPTGWSNRDIGAVSAAGSASYASSTATYTVRGSGADVWGTADEFHFVSKPMSGNGTITARVASASGSDAWTKAGVMMRETTAANAKHASMFVSTGKGLSFQRRTATGGASTATAGAMAGPPYWVRLQRSGNTFIASVSSNGSTWTVVGSETIAMASTIQVGLAVTSHLDGSLATASFTNVTAP